jgi:hypothetical protein
MTGIPNSTNPPVEPCRVRVIDATRRATLQHKRRHAEFYKWDALASQYLYAVIAAVIAAIKTDDEGPLTQLPPPWAERTVAAFRQERAGRLWSPSQQTDATRMRPTANEETCG